MSPLHTLSARQIAQAVARREITAEAVVRSHLERVAALDPELHAWQFLDSRQALEQARELDRRGPAGPLAGVPVGVKDLLDTADQPTSYGSPIYAHHRPQVDAACVAGCRDAGALILGKTVTTEFATFKPGPTRNPHSTPQAPHTPGGSSSGSAAAVAAHMVPLAFGTQTAASIVRPAAFCGIVGYKPTHNLLPLAGVKSLSPSLDTVGGFARSVDDVALFIGALARLDLTPVVPEKLRVGLCRTPHWELADADARRAWNDAAQAFKDAGAELVEVELPESWAGLAQAQMDIMNYEARSSFAAERREQAGGFSPAFAQVLAGGDAVDRERLFAAQALAVRLRAELETLFRLTDVLIAPSARGEAPAGLDSTGDPVFSRLWSLLGAPCVQVPVGQGSHGLPVGVTVIGPRWNDTQALGAALLLERSLG